MDADSESEIVSEVALEYLQQKRAGNRPRASDYVKRYPHLADQIRDAVSMMELMEDVASEPKATPDQRLDRLGEYDIHRIIGRGGMGTVYEATQESLGRRVALKVCPLQGSQRQRERFRRESRSAAMLHHSNIVPVFSVGEADGYLYYAMQYIRGATLGEVITELQQLWRTSPDASTRLSDALVPTGETTIAFQVAKSMSNGGSGDSDYQSPPESAEPHVARVSLPGQTSHDATNQPQSKYWDSVARIGLQVAEALAYAHGKDTLHRDIKPSNLMLDQSGVVWLMDFGLAKSMEEDDLTRDGELIGTLRYMAPEQVAGKPTSSSDIYSLGLTLYEMLTLRPAFDELSRNALLKAVSHRDPVAPRRLNAHVPRDLETIVLKTIERDEGRRYGSARELADDLGRFLAGEPIEARPITVTERLRKWARRRPMVAALTTALTLLFCVAFVLITWQWRAAVVARNDAELRTDEAVQARYRSGVSRVEAISRTAPRTAAQLLQSFVPEPGAPDRRGWEWGYLNQVVSQSAMVMQCGAPGAEWIRSLAFSPDESMLAVGACRTGFVLPANQSPKGRVTLWDVRQAKQIQEFPINDSGWSIGISRDNARVAICEARGTTWEESKWSGPTWIWDVDSAKRLVQLKVPKVLDRARESEDPQPAILRTSDLVFFDDDARLIGTLWSKSRIPAGTAIWNTRTGEALWFKPRSEFIQHDAAKKELLIADYARDGYQVKWLDLETKDERDVIGRIPISGRPFEQFVLGMGLPGSKDRVFLQDIQTDKRILLWGDDQYKATRAHSGRPVASAHPTHDSLAVGASDGTVRIWNSQIGELKRILHGHAIDVQSVAYSPSGNWLASGDWHGEVRLWKPERYSHYVTCRPLGRSLGCLLEDIAFRYGSSNLVGSGVILDQGRTGDIGIRSHVTCWEPASGLRLQDYHAPAIDTQDRRRTTQFDPSGRHLATIGRDHTLRVNDYETNAIMIEKHWPDTRLENVALGCDAELVATSQTRSAKSRPSETSGRVAVLDINKQETLKEFQVAAAGALSLSPTARKLAFAFSNSTDRPTSSIRYYDFATQKTRDLKVPERASRVAAIEFSNDNRRLAVAWEMGVLGIYDLSDPQNGEPVFRTIPPGIEDLAWHPSGTRLAGANREFVTLWDDQGQVLLELRGKPRSGDLAFDAAVTFSPDGTKLAATLWDNSVRVWSSSQPSVPDSVREELRLPTPSDDVAAPVPREAQSVVAMQSAIEHHPDNPWYIAAKGQLGQELRDAAQTKDDYLAAKQQLAGDDPCLLIHGEAYIESRSLPLGELDGYTFEAWVKHWNYQQPGQVYGVIATQYPQLPREYFARKRLADRNALDNFGYYWLRPTSVYTKVRTEWSHIAVCFAPERRTYLLNGRQIGKSTTPAKAPDGPFFIADTPFHNPQVKGRGLIRSLRVTDGVRYEFEEDFQPQEKLESDSNTVLLYDFTVDDGLNGSAPNIIQDRSGNERHGTLRRAWWLPF